MVLWSDAFGRADYGQSIANVPENQVNLKGNEAPYSPDISLQLDMNIHLKWVT